MRQILLLGATGRTGQLALEYALARGHRVVALVRNPDKITLQSEHLRVVRGTPENPVDVARAIGGCDAVLSALNNNRTSDWLWARPVSPPRFMTTSVGHCIAAMREQGVRRIAVLSAFGAGDSSVYAPLYMRLITRHTNIRLAYADHDAQEKLLENSGLDWTLVRAVGLTESATLKTLVVSENGYPRPAVFISRRQTARFMVDCLDDPETVGKAPVISER